MVWETGVHSQVESYQRLKKWYLMLHCLTLSIIRYRSRVKWSNPGKGVVPTLTPRCSSYWKGSLQVTLNYGHQLYFTYFHLSSSSSCADITDFLNSLAPSISVVFGRSSWWHPVHKIDEYWSLVWFLCLMAYQCL